MTLKQKFLIPLLSLLIISISSIGLLSFIEQSRDLKEMFVNNMMYSEKLLSNATDIWFKDRYNDISSLSRNSFVIKSLGDNFISKSSRYIASKQMRELIDSSNIYKNIYLLSNTGYILASSKQDQKAELPSHLQSIFIKGMNKLKSSSETIFAKDFIYEDKDYYALITKTSEESKPKSKLIRSEGVLVAVIRMESLAQSMFLNIPELNVGIPHLYNRNGFDVQRGHVDISNYVANIKHHSELKENRKPITIENDNKDDELLIAHKIDNHPFIIGVKIDRSSFIEPAYRIAYKFIFIVIIVSVLTSALVIIFLKWLLEPIQNLAETAKTVTEQKNYSIRAKRDSDDELGDLINTFNDMLHEIGKREKALKKAKKNIEKTAKNLAFANKIAEQKYKEAEKANNAKSEFLAKMSHELRTPLNSIIGLSNILLEEEMNQKQSEMVAVVKKSSNILLEVVNDILDVSKIEHGSITLENLVFDFGATVLDVIDTLKPLADEKEIDLTSSLEKDQLFVSGDPVRVKRILINLISNAIKYTASGYVQVVVSYRTINNKKIEIICEIIDTGIGIPDERLNNIFDKFTQADDSITRKFGGTGLGLTITKQLVSLMKGTITVSSQVDKGSVFTVKIPFETTSVMNEEIINKKEEPVELKISHTQIPVDKAKVLIAEDNKLNQAFVVTLLDKLGFKKYDIAWDGSETFDLFREEKDYDIIFMDCHMPEMNGYQATQAIRDFEKENNIENIPIIAMTADTMSGVKEACIKSGMNNCILKPIDVEELKSILSQWIELE